jgi:DNA-binding transcriptional MerR regulator
MTEFSIANVASLTNLTPYTLRYYERIGLVSSVNRDQGGKRSYDENDLGWIRFLQMLRSTGMPLKQIAQFVELEKRGAHTLDERRALLRAQRLRLQEHLAEASAALQALNEKIEYYDAANPSNCSCMAGGERGRGENSNGT